MHLLKHTPTPFLIQTNIHTLHSYTRFHTNTYTHARTHAHAHTLAHTHEQDMEEGEVRTAIHLNKQTPTTCFQTQLPPPPFLPPTRPNPKPTITSTSTPTASRVGGLAATPRSRGRVSEKISGGGGVVGGKGIEWVGGAGAGKSSNSVNVGRSDAPMLSLLHQQMNVRLEEKAARCSGGEGVSVKGPRGQVKVCVYVCERQNACVCVRL